MKNDISSSRGSKKGCLIAVLFVVAAIILFFCFVVPSLLRSIEVSQVKRSMGDLRTMATAVEAYRATHGCYPETATVEELSGLLEPTYIRALPRRDGWNNEIRYQAWRENPLSPGPDAYAVASPGKDGAWEKRDLRDYEGEATEELERDVVFRSGSFVQYLGRTQK